jgi:hypothetical protein
MLKDVMKKRLVFLFVLAMLALCHPAFAVVSSTANRQTTFNNVTDYLATAGKSEQDKKEIVEERRDSRREARLKSAARQKNVQTRKKMKAQEELIMRKVRAQNN